jgi:hypothetical protein
MAADTRGGRGWIRAAGLLLVTAGFSIAQPGVLIAVPFILLAFVVPPHTVSSVVLAGIGGVLVFGTVGSSGFWFVERGWAVLLGGWFVALTLRFPQTRFSSRALGAVGGTFAVVATLLAVRPGDWETLHWLVGGRIQQGLTGALDALRLMGGGEPLSQRLVAAAYQTADVQEAVFPALLGLTSISALGVAWWLYVRLARGSDQGVGPLRDFRFNDQLVWVLIAGLILVVMGWGEAWSRAGTNALVFMGALYALRGAAVIVFLYGGLNLLGMIVFLIGLVFVAPVVVASAMVVGIGDTWLDLRTRARPDVNEEH